RWIEPDLLDVLGEEGIGCVAFSPLSQGLLSDRYLDGVPPGSRATQNRFLKEATLTDELRGRLRALSEVAARRGQTLAQTALAGTLRDPRVTTAVFGASSVAQLEANVKAVERLDLEADELAAIDALAPA